MTDFGELLEELLPKGWEYEAGYGMDGLLICPHGHQIEQDGECPDGCISPLREMGMIQRRAPRTVNGGVNIWIL